MNNLAKREDVIRAARLAGLDVGDVENELTSKVTTEIFCRDHDYYQDNQEIGYLVQTHDLISFASVILAQERERLALKVEEMGMQGFGTLAIAAAIRRGND